MATALIKIPCNTETKNTKRFKRQLFIRLRNKNPDKLKGFKPADLGQIRKIFDARTNEIYWECWYYHNRFEV